MNEKFSSRLREARGAMSQAEFCSLIDVKQGTYSTWELGKYEPPLDMVTKIARATKTSADWLLGLSTAPPSIAPHKNHIVEQTLHRAVGECQECARLRCEVTRLNKIIDKLLK